MDKELQQLKDIHLPNPIHMWPIAPGWIILLLMMLGLLSYLIYFFYQERQRKKAIQFALFKLKTLQDLVVNNPLEINIAAEISTLIRRTAIYYFKREVVAGLSGEDWLTFLNKSGNTSKFTECGGLLLNDAPYRKNNDGLDVIPLFDLTKSWLLHISKKQRSSLEN